MIAQRTVGVAVICALVQSLNFKLTETTKSTESERKVNNFLKKKSEWIDLPEFHEIRPISDHSLGKRQFRLGVVQMKVAEAFLAGLAV